MPPTTHLRANRISNLLHYICLLILFLIAFTYIYTYYAEAIRGHVIADHRRQTGHACQNYTSLRAVSV